SYEEIEKYTKWLRQEFLKIKLAKKVVMIGARARQYEIVISNYKLSQYNMSIEEIINILKTQNVFFPSPIVKTEKDIIRIDISGNYESLNEIENTIIKSYKNSSFVRLKDVFDINYSYDENPISIMRFNGEKSLGLGINIIDNGNVIDLGKKVKDKIAILQNKLPIGININIVNFQPENVSLSINRFASNLIASIGIVTAVLLFFLGIKTGIIVGIGLPLTIAATFLLMYVINIDLQMVSLGALIIALGMLVDNSIVITELIMVKLQKGVERLKACKDAVSETYIPLLTSTLIACAVFLCIPLSKSMTGEYTMSLFQVVTISLICSWILSITVAPLMCYKWLYVEKTNQSEIYSSKFYKYYKKILIRLINNRKRFLLILTVLFFISIFSMKLLPISFFPDSERNSLVIDFYMPNGTKIDYTEKEVIRLEKKLMKYNEIISVASYIGTGSPRFYLTIEPKLPQSYYAQLILNMDSKKSSKDFINKIYEIGNMEFPDSRLRVYRLPLGPYSENSVEFRLKGENKDVLKDFSNKVKKILFSNIYTVDVTDNWGVMTKKVIVEVNQYKAKKIGISSQDISIALYGFINGIEISRFRGDDELIPIILRSPDSERFDINKLENIYIISSITGVRVPLSSIADIKYEWEDSKICRLNNEAFIEIGCKTRGALPADVLADVITDIKKIDIPENYKFEIAGEYKMNKDAISSIIKTLPIIFILILLLLILQFNSFRKALIIILTVMLGIIGVVVGLILTGQEFGFMCMLGIISLTGMIIKNSIVIIDKIDFEISNGKEIREAVINSGLSRLRPVMLAAFTTVFGMLPLALQPDGLFTSMAIAIVSGLSFATVLTLGAVPALYVLFYKNN
ncbi:MAG: efflux RND transporter permease subunit, partial [Candidatus Muirbacterium halophilum]|nr:efflux RND transporter permease subunit [Candidatus Muirbacterium halophilum]